MQNQKHEVPLAPPERQKLLAVVSTGRNEAAVIRRAHILLKTDEGQTDTGISQALYICEQTVRRTRIRYCEEGLQRAIDDKPHPQPELKLDAEKEAYLIALACSKPPAGRKRWTLELLAQQLVDDGIVAHIVPETVRLTLKKNSLKPWQVKSWCIPAITAQFLASMEHILRLYQQPYDRKRPMICFDEKSTQLLADKRAPISMKKG